MRKSVKLLAALGAAAATAALSTGVPAAAQTPMQTQAQMPAMYVVMFRADWCAPWMYDAESTAMHIRNLKTYAVSNQPSMDFTCPEPNG